MMASTAYISQPVTVYNRANNLPQLPHAVSSKSAPSNIFPLPDCITGNSNLRHNDGHIVSEKYAPHMPHYPPPSTTPVPAWLATKATEKQAHYGNDSRTGGNNSRIANARSIPRTPRHSIGASVPGTKTIKAKWIEFTVWVKIGLVRLQRNVTSRGSRRRWRLRTIPVVSLRTLYAHDVSPGSSPVNGLRTAASASSGSAGSGGREPIPDYRPGPPIATHDSADSSSGKKRGVTQIQDDRIDYPRRRAVIACEICRARKSKCDGAQPKCRLCNDLNAECVYRERGLKLDARDKLILDKLDNIESILQNSVEKEQLQTQIIQRFGLQLQENFQQQQAQRLSGGRAAPNEPCTRYLASGVVESSPQISHGSSASGREQVSSDSHREYVFSIPEHHSTPWLHLFQHPKISRFLSSSPPWVLSPLALEKSRPPLQLNANVLLDLSHVQPFVTSFFKNVNPFYALVSPFSWKSYYRIALSRGFRAGPESVIVLLVLALGEASMKESLSVWLPDGPIPGLKFFASAWPLVTNILISNSIIDAEALMLTSAYLFYLVRPLEAWTILSATCMKVRAIIATTPPETLLHDEKEQFERVFWNALVFESDVLAELDLPHSGIEVHEDEVGLPSGFISVPEAAALAPGTDDLWYFLAEVALRRLLNRVHHMLYSKTVKMPISSYHPIVQELDFQLNQWYENLPPVLRFSFERRRLDNRFSTVLRLRYFACQSIIWRVYVEVALQDEQLLQDTRIRMGASKCIEACLRQIEDIDEHQAGHVPYLWQGSLSIVSHLLMLMAVTTSSGLSQLLPYKLDRMADIVTVGIRTIIRNGKLAPSINAAAESLCDVERQWAAQMRELGVVLPDLSIETINVPRGG